MQKGLQFSLVLTGRKETVGQNLVGYKISMGDLFELFKIHEVSDNNQYEP